MPAGFDMCRKKGGKIRSVKQKDGSSLPVCYLGGKAFRGYVMKKHNSSANKSKESGTADAIKSHNSSKKSY